MSDERCRFGTQPTAGAMLIWEITNLCNLECLHCCTNSSPFVSVQNEVADADVFRALAEFRAIPVKEVMFSGGEPFLRENLMGFIECAAASGADVYIASNGTLISNEIAKGLRLARIKRLDISLDGDLPEIHQQVRVHPLAFDRTIRGIRACVKQNVPLRVSTVITPRNFMRLDSFIGLLVNLGVKSVVISSIQGSSGRALHYPHLGMQHISEEAIRNVLIQATKKYADAIQIDCRLFQEYSSSPSGCPAGKSVLHISINGDVSPCSWLYKLDRERFSLGNIKQDSLSECVSRSATVLEPLAGLTKGCLIPYVRPT